MTPASSSAVTEHGHKRKRKSSPQDSHGDPLGKRAAVLGCLETFKGEIDRTEETDEEELQTAVDEGIAALGNILKGGKKRVYRVFLALCAIIDDAARVTFSTVSENQLVKAGIVGKRLSFRPAKVTELANALPTTAEPEIAQLRTRIEQIYARVNMDCEAGSRMILDAVLLALAGIASTQERGAVILSELKIGEGDGVLISHPDTGYKLWLSGKVDYAVVENEALHKSQFLAPAGSGRYMFNLPQGHLLLIEAKRQGEEKKLLSCIPEAVSQAIALIRLSNLPEVRFCLSDGQMWLFFILKLENEIITYYESPPLPLSKDALVNSDMPIRNIIQLLHEWLIPTRTDLYVLEQSVV